MTRMYLVDVLLFEEFNDPRLAELYDTVCPLSADSTFHLRTIDELDPQSVLDVGCGTGALTVEIARTGRTVTGVDPAEPMIRIARRRPDTDLVRWVHGQADDVGHSLVDMALMTAHVAQVITDDQALQSTFNAIADRLTVSGTLIFDSRNPVFQGRGWTAAWNQPQRFVHPVAGGFVVTQELTGAEDNLTTYELRYEFANGTKLVSHNELRFRSQEQLTSMLDNAGLVVRQLFGDWDRAAVDKHSPELIFVAGPT